MHRFNFRHLLDYSMQMNHIADTGQPPRGRQGAVTAMPRQHMAQSFQLGHIET